MMEIRQLLRTVAAAVVATLVAMPQPVQAQKMKDFQDAMATSRGFAQYYHLPIAYPEKKTDKAKEKAEKLGFKVVEVLGNVKSHWPYTYYLNFVPADEYQSYMNECNFVIGAAVALDPRYGPNLKDDFRRIYAIPPSESITKNLKGSDFKSGGSAYLFNEGGNSLSEFTDVYWTGDIKNGKIDGRGDGYAVQKNVYYTFSGAFTDGVPSGKGTFARGTVRNGTHLQILRIQTDEASEGMVAFRGYEEATPGKVKYNRFLDSRNHTIVAQYNDIKQNFKDGKAIINDRGMDIVIDRAGKFLAIAEGVSKIPKSYFDNSRFDDMASITIPSSVTVIEEGAFRNRRALKTVALQQDRRQGLVIFEEYCFAGCTSLQEITVPSTVEWIKEGAFYGCTSLKSVTIPVTAKSIGYEAFKNCTSLESVNIAGDVQWINLRAFANCTSLKSATVHSSNLSKIEGLRIFEGCNQLASVTVVDDNGNQTQDSEWYWKKNESEESKQRRELADKRYAEEKARKDIALANSYDYPKPTEDAWFNPVKTDLHLKFEFGVTAFSGYVRWDNPRLVVAQSIISGGKHKSSRVCTGRISRP